MTNEQIEVPVEVIEALEEARQIGTYNMLDANGVVSMMYANKHYAAVLWLTDSDRNSDRVKVNHKRYMAALHELGQIKNVGDELSR